MSLLILLSVEILFISILFIFLSKTEFKPKTRFIFWFISLISLSVPAINVLKTSKNLGAYVGFKIMEQDIFLTLNTISAIFVILLIFCGLIFAIYELNPKFQNRTSQTKECIYSSLILVFSLLSMLFANIGLYILNYLIIGFLTYKLISEFSKDAAVKYIDLYYISSILLVFPILIVSSFAGSTSFIKLTEIFAEKNAISNMFYLSIIIGLLLQIFAIFRSNFYLKHDFYKNTILSLFLTPIITLTSTHGILAFVSIAAVPQRIAACISASFIIFLSIVTAVLQKYISDKYNKLVLLNISNILFVFFVISLALIGVAYNLPAIAILGIITYIIAVINNILGQTLIYLSCNQNENFCLYKILEIFGLTLYSGIPFTLMFFIILTSVISVFLTFFTKTHGLCLVIPFVLLILYLVINAKSIINMVKYVSHEKVNIQSCHSNFIIILSVSVLLITVLVELSVFPLTKLAVIPAAMIINQNMYKDFYNTLINFSNVYQWFVICCILLITSYILIKFLIKQIIHKRG